MTRKIKSMMDLASVSGYLRRIGAEQRSMRTAVVKEREGNYWTDIAKIVIDKNGEVDVSNELYSPTEAEAAAIKAECAGAQWPEVKLVRRASNLPDEIKNADPKNVFEFRDYAGNILMLQLRREQKGGKAYIPYTYWDDGEWRTMEPEGKLPLWGLDAIKENATVFIHEGAKAARAMREMVEARTPEMKAKLAAHPWGEEMSNAAHVGWIGGALSPMRTDWSILKEAGVTRAYIVSDNDHAGVRAVPAIAQQLRMPTFHVQFTKEWPVSFDMADDFPKEMFKTEDGLTHYTGPAFKACLHPATWATDLIPNRRGKPTVVLRKNFEEFWAYAEEADLFVCTEMTDIVRNEQVLNKMLASFSHTMRTTDLIIRSYSGRNVKLCYRPDIEGNIVTADTTSALNLHTPPLVKRNKASPAKWLEFMTYLFPNKDERHEVLRWCATLIARPDIHMEYGVLLISERHGIGKTTLGSNILAPLVGKQNTSWPTETLIVQSEFNGWLAHKRLVVVNEIYSGHSWKAYNKLKTIITDREVEVNQKFQRTYKIDNWAHIMACSNDLRALKIEENDRRWYHPEVQEQPWPREKFVALHTWLEAGGLGAIMDWAFTFGDYVLPGQHAPMTQRKRELIEDSKTEGVKAAARLAEAFREFEQPALMTMRDVAGWVRSSVQGHMYEADHELRKAMKGDATWLAARIKIDRQLQHVVVNKAAIDRLREAGYVVHIAEGSARIWAGEGSANGAMNGSGHGEAGGGIGESYTAKDGGGSATDDLRKFRISPTDILAPSM